MFDGGTIAVPDYIMKCAVESFALGIVSKTYQLESAKDIITSIALSGKLPVGTATFTGVPFLQVFSVGGNISEGVIEYALSALVAVQGRISAVIISTIPGEPNAFVVSAGVV